MKKFVLAFAALSAFAAAPAMARSDTHISFGFYSSAPVYYQPAPVYYAPPVVYYPPVNRVYYAPRVVRYEPPCPRRYGYGVVAGYGPRGYHGHGRSYDTAWNAPDDDHDDGYHQFYGRR